MSSISNTIQNNMFYIGIFTMWSYTGYLSYCNNIENGHNFEDSIKGAIMTFPLCIIFFCLYAIYVVSPAFMWSEIFEKTYTDQNFDFFDIIFLIGQSLEE